MFSKVISRVSQYQQLTSLQTRAFRASAVANANQKPSIGDAVTILQSKVSGINQVVSSNQLFVQCVEKSGRAIKDCAAPLKRSPLRHA